MKKIDTSGHYPYRELFTVSVNTQKLCYTAVGVDADGNYILHKSGTSNNSSGYGSWDEYYFLSKSEYERYAGSSRGYVGAPNPAPKVSKKKSKRRR